MMAKGKLKILGSVNKFSLPCSLFSLPNKGEGKFFAWIIKVLVEQTGTKKLFEQKKFLRRSRKKDNLYYSKDFLELIFCVCVLFNNCAWPTRLFSVHMLLIFQAQDKLG